MEKTTVLAKIQITVSLTEEIVIWMTENFPDAWFSRNYGNEFLREFTGVWWKSIKPSFTHEINSFFLEAGIHQKDSPFIAHPEFYDGSWVIDTAILMKGSIGNSYLVLKEAVGDLSVFAEKLSNKKNSLSNNIASELEREIRETLYSTVSREITRDNKNAPSIQLPQSIITTNFVIDARPLASLTPSKLHSYQVHLSVAISRDACVIENLGTEALENIKIGLFRSPTQRNRWSFEDSFISSLSQLSSKQTISKKLTEFKKTNTTLSFDLTDNQNTFVECWIQDNFGIYLFMFLLEKE